MTQEKRIDFNKLSKPANLQNSAVLRMLEEEDQKKKLGKPGLRRVEWPPTTEGSIDYVDFVEQNPVQSKTRGLGEYATYQAKSPTLREESAAPKPNYQASPISQPSFQYQVQAQPPPRSWTPGTPTSTQPPQQQQQQPKEYIIPVSSSWKSPGQPSPVQAPSKPKSWASVAPASPQAPSPQQEYIVPVSCNWKPEAAPAQQVSQPKSWSSVQPKEYIVPVSCPWKGEPSQPSVFQPPKQFEQPSANLPALNTWKPQAEQPRPKSSAETWSPRPQVQIQIKQTPPTPTLNTWNNEKPPQPFGSTWSDYPQQQQQQHTLAVSQEIESPQSYKPQSSAAHFEPPATLITLRSEPPISQEPSPVYHAQPAATTAADDGINMRGDEKWPPASVKEQTEVENQARIDLAKGPACRPRKVKKDYTQFFAQHAVTNNYPGYRAPPGTQYFTPAYQQ